MQQLKPQVSGNISKVLGAIHKILGSVPTFFFSGTPMLPTRMLNKTRTDTTVLSRLTPVAQRYRSLLDVTRVGYTVVRDPTYTPESANHVSSHSFLCVLSNYAVTPTSIFYVGQKENKNRKRYYSIFSTTFARSLSRIEILASFFQGFVGSKSPSDCFGEQGEWAELATVRPTSTNGTDHERERETHTHNTRGEGEEGSESWKKEREKEA